MAVWTPPGSLTKPVSAGVVVTVRARLQAGQPAIGPDAQGRIPHVVYRPDLRPLGTSAAYAYNSLTGDIGPALDERPTESIDDPIPGETPEWWIDLGVPFRCPWDGHLVLEGGAVVAPDTTTALDVSIVRTMPQDVTEMRAMVDVIAGPCQRMRSRQTGPSPIAPLQPLSITYQQVPGRPQQIPRGAYAVVSPAAVAVDFIVFGVTTTLALPAGVAVQLGILAQGMFQAPAPPINQLSFLVQIA